MKNLRIKLKKLSNLNCLFKIKQGSNLKRKEVQELLFFFMDSVKTDMREKWRVKKKIKLALNRTSSSYMRYQEGREHRDASNGRMKHFFSTTAIIHTPVWWQWSGWCMLCRRFCFFLSKENITPYTKQLLLKKPSWNDELASAKMLWGFSLTMTNSRS